MLACRPHCLGSIFHSGMNLYHATTPMTIAFLACCGCTKGRVYGDCAPVYLHADDHVNVHVNGHAHGHVHVHAYDHVHVHVHDGCGYDHALDDAHVRGYIFSFIL